MRIVRVMRLAAVLLLSGFTLNAALGAVSRATIDFPDALGAELGSTPQRTVRIVLLVQGKELKGVLVMPAARNPALAAWDARDVKSTLAGKGDRLEGAIEANVFPATSEISTAWSCAIKATWKGGVLAGKAVSTQGGWTAEMEFTTRPEAITLPKANDAFVELFLPPGEGGRVVRAGIMFKNGKAVAAAAFAPLIHPVWQRIDASKLVLRSGRLSGRLHWPAEDPESGEATKPSRSVELKADLRKGVGFLEGEGAGGLALLSAEHPVREEAEVEIAFDAPLLGAERWRRRAVLRLNRDGAAATATAFLNGRAESGWTGTTDSLAFEFTGDGFKGAIESTIASATVQPGFYRIEFRGHIVGPWLVGSFESKLAGESVATGALTGWWNPGSR